MVGWSTGTLMVYLFPFLSTGDPDPTNLITNRISLVGTVQSFWDANSHVNATLFSAVAQYKPNCPTSAIVCPYGAPSLSLQYDNGTDKDSLQKQSKVTVKFTYAY
jgi:hypothetical protein